MRLFYLLFLLLTANTPLADTFSDTNQANRIEYQLIISDATHHLAQVQITFPDVQTRVLEVKLPVWRSGRYEILDLSKAVSAFTAHHKNGKSINWLKTNKNTWKLLLNQPGDVTIQYEVYANTLKQRVIHIDPTHAYLDASGVFMFAPAFRKQPLTVELNVPNPWQSRSGMKKTGAHQFVAENYDQLVDSPIETGIHEYLTFEVGNKTYEIVIWGEGNHDIEDLKKQVSLMHDAAKNIWNDFPFERYLYIYHAGDDLRGATEHVNSTIIQQKRFNFKPRSSYLKVLATTAHEFIHTWNVKAYRPAGIAPYDYSTENYSDLFWMAEGITSYYDDLMLMRVGIYEPKEYFEQMADNIQKHLKNPGRHQKSLAASSFDTWLKQDAQLNHNDSVSIYTEGSMVAWRLDQEIRKLTNNKASLDTLQKRLYQQHNNTDKGYHNNDVLMLLKAITDHDFQPFWNQYVEGTQAINFDELLNFYGLQRKFNTQEDKSSEIAWIGVDLSFENEKVHIKTVDRDSPAWLTGLSAGDQILSIDGIQVSPDNIQKRIEQLIPEHSYQIHYFSAGRLQQSTLKAQSNPFPEFTIEPVTKPSRKQRAHYQSWTGQKL